MHYAPCYLIWSSLGSPIEDITCHVMRAYGKHAFTNHVLFVYISAYFLAEG
jgi:hypothetical protein